MHKPSVSIIGLGKVGLSLLHTLSLKGFEIRSAGTRSPVTKEMLSAFPGVLFTEGLPKKQEQLGEFVIISVSDDAIEGVCSELSRGIRDLTGHTVVHCSGNHASAILHSAKKAGAATASFHPLKAIKGDSRSYDGIWFDLEGDDKALKVCEQVCGELGAHSFRIMEEDKIPLHTAAVISSNYMVVLAELVQRVAGVNGMKSEEVLQAMIPLMQHTLDNISKSGPAGALTGPVERGDIHTVKKHLNSLKDQPELITLYRQLGLIAAELAAENKGQTSKLNAIMALFSNEGEKK